VQKTLNTNSQQTRATVSHTLIIRLLSSFLKLYTSRLAIWCYILHRSISHIILLGDSHPTQLTDTHWCKLKMHYYQYTCNNNNNNKTKKHNVSSPISRIGKAHKPFTMLDKPNITTMLKHNCQWVKPCSRWWSWGDANDRPPQTVATGSGEVRLRAVRWHCSVQGTSPWCLR